MTKKNLRLLYRIAFVLITLLLLYILSTFGVFNAYAHLFSDKHHHRDNTFFRIGFLIVFTLINYFYFVPHFYIKKRYVLFFSVIMFCLVTMLLLPEFIIEQPKFDPAKFGDQKPQFSKPHLPIPLPLFEMVNAILLFCISTFLPIIKQIQSDLQTIEREEKTTKFNAEPNIEKENVDFQEKNTDFEAKNEPFQENNTDFETEINNFKGASITAVTKQLETALTVTVNYSLVRIEFSDILFIKSMDNYLQFYLINKKPILVRMTLKDALNKLPTEGFLRVHKSYIVAISAIENIRNKTILTAEQDIPIGRAYETAVFTIFGKV